MDETTASVPSAGGGDAPVVTTSLVSRMMNVVAAPGDVFAEVKASPGNVANWLAPALVWLVVAWLGVWLVWSQEAVRQQISDIQEKQFEKAIASGKMTRQQLDAQRPMIEKFSNGARLIGQTVGPVALAFASPFWWGLVYWLLGAKLFKGQFGYMKGVEVAGVTNVVAILESAVTALMVVVFGNMFAAPGAILLFKDADPTSWGFGLAAMANAMTLWILALRALGLARLSGISTTLSAVWVFGLWAMCRVGLIQLGQLMQRLQGMGGGG